MSGTAVAPYSSASLSGVSNDFHCNTCNKVILVLSSSQTTQSIAQEVQLHIQKCMGFSELNKDPTPDKNLAPVFALQPRRTWSAEDERRKRLEDDPDAYDVGPHSVTCAGCHRPIRLNATGRYYAANWNKHKMGCKTANSVSGWGTVTAESRFTGRVAAFRVTKPTENTELACSPSGSADSRPSYSPHAQVSSSIDPYMGRPASPGAQRSSYDATTPGVQTPYYVNHPGGQYTSEGLVSTYPPSGPRIAEDSGLSAKGIQIEVAPFDPSSSRKQVRPAFSTAPLPRLVQRDSSAYAERRAPNDQKSIHALATALRRSRSDFSQASTTSALDTGFPVSPIRASPGQPDSPSFHDPADKGKGKDGRTDTSLRPSTHTFHAQYRYTYPSISPDDSPIQGRRSPFIKSPPSATPRDIINPTRSREGGQEAPHYHDHRDPHNRFSPDTGSATTSSSSSGFSPRSVTSIAYSPSNTSHSDDARTLPSLSSLSLQRNEKVSFRAPASLRGSGDLNSYASTTVSLPPLGVRDDSESIVLPPIRDISTASVALGSPSTTKRRLGENEDYDKEHSADHRPSLPRLNIQSGRQSQPDYAGRSVFLDEQTSPVYGASFPSSLPQRLNDRLNTIGGVSDSTSNGSDFYPSPRELSPASSDADAGNSAGRLHPVWKWEKSRGSPNSSQLSAREDCDNDVDMAG